MGVETDQGIGASAFEILQEADRERRDLGGENRFWAQYFPASWTFRWAALGCIDGWVQKEDAKDSEEENKCGRETKAGLYEEEKR